MDTLNHIVVDEIENNIYTQQVHDLFNLVYGDYAYIKTKQYVETSTMMWLTLEEKINIYLSWVIDNIDEDIIIEKWIKELNRSSIPNSVINIYLWNYTSVQWRSEKLKTTEWKCKICAIVTAMFKYEKRLTT